MLLRLPDRNARAQAQTGDSAGPADRPELERELQVQRVGCFEGWSLTTLACDQRPMWMVGELAGVLGYEDPATLIGVLAQRWVERCPEGAIIYLDGGDRRELLDKLERAQVVLHPTRRRKPIVLLAMSAIDELVASNTSAVGRRLRTHLREQVVPEFHAWLRAGQALDQPILSLDAATIAANRLEFERRCFQAAVLERLLDRLELAGSVDGDQLATHRVVASEIALGAYLDEFDEILAHGWATPTQIAARWCGLTPMRVGRLIAHLGLKGSRAHSRAILTKARGHDRTVVSHVYSPAAVALIERELRSRGHRRCEGCEGFEAQPQQNPQEL